MKIAIPVNEVFDEIKMNAYYSGESRKSKEEDIYVIQASDDDLTGVQGYLGTAANDCCGYLQLVGPTSYTNAGKVIEYLIIDEKNCNPLILPLLRKAVVDYIVYFTLYMWMGNVRPDLRGIFIEFRDKAIGDVLKFSSMIARKPIRRRPTDLAGI